MATRSRSSRGGVVRRRVLVIGVGLALATVAPSAAAVPGPIDGVSVSVQARHPVTGLTQAVVGGHAGYIGEADASFPRVGDVFYLRGFVATTGTLGDLPVMSFLFDTALAPDIELAIGAATPVRCFFHPDLLGPPQADPGCRQDPEPGLAGGAFFGARELDPGQGFEVQVPVRVRAPKLGFASGPAAQFGVHIRSVFGDALATQHLIVAPGAPAGPARPASPATAPRDLAAPRLSRLAVRVSRAGAARLRVRIGETARVTVTLLRRGPGGRVTKVGRPRVRRLAAGTRAIALGRLRPGRYSATVRARDASGNVATARRAFTIRAG